jgi:hypothetical protein
LNDTLEFTLLKSGEGADLSGHEGEHTAAGHSFRGKCRGFLEGPQLGILVEPKEELERIIEGEGYVPCRLIPGSVMEKRVGQRCSYGTPCEIDAELGVHDYNVDVLEIHSHRSWDSWKGTCYGPVGDGGDGEYSIGVVEVEISNRTTVPIRCWFFLEAVSTKILKVCPLGSTCEVRARFESKPQVQSVRDAQTAIASIGYVDSVQLKELPKNPEPYSETRPDGSSSLELCAAAINDPLRYMLIDVLISGGKHLGPKLDQVKTEIEGDYGPFLKVRDDATIERVDQLTGKIGCAVTYEADLQGLAAKVVQLGGNARAQILLRQISQQGKFLIKRVEYTVQRTSGGSFVVWFGLQSSPAVRPR